MKTTDEIIEDAADLIEKGWCKRNYIDADGNVCAVEALWQVIFADAQDHGTDYTRFKEVRNAINRVLPEPDMSIIGWNDDPDRTKQEVLDAFRLAAKDARRDN